jgi:hypothetical protein
VALNTSDEQFRVWWAIYHTPSMEPHKEMFRKAYCAGYDYSALIAYALNTRDPVVYSKREVS